MKNFLNILYILLPILIIGVSLNIFYKNKMKEYIIQRGTEKEVQLIKNVNDLNIPKENDAYTIKINRVKISKEAKDVELDQILIYKVSIAILFEGELPDNYVISSITEGMNTIEIWIINENIHKTDLLFESRKYVFEWISGKYFLKKTFSGQ